MALDEAIVKYFGQKRFQATLWKPEKEHLINEPVQLQEFAENPTNFIPLYNCFQMAELPSESVLEWDEVEESDFADSLGRVTTNYINKVWQSYPTIKIKFHIGGGKLTLLIEDKGVMSRSKTIEQRSDGFRWFIFFLLTIAPGYSGNSPTKSILLLDEPETHLHPQAQADLLKELIKITQEMNRETVLFFATHSAHMVDKEHIDRCYKFSKHNGVTEFERADSGLLNSYAEVNYSVFEVAGNDYHNELYGYLASTEEGREKLKELPKYSKPWNNERTKKPEDVSLSTYIRHSIHHPENNSNPDYTEAEFKESIKTMQGLVKDLQAENSGKVPESAPDSPVETANES